MRKKIWTGSSLKRQELPIREVETKRPSDISVQQNLEGLVCRETGSKNGRRIGVPQFDVKRKANIEGEEDKEKSARESESKRNKTAGRYHERHDRDAQQAGKSATRRRNIAASCLLVECLMPAVSTCLIARHSGLPSTLPLCRRYGLVAIFETVS